MNTVNTTVKQVLKMNSTDGPILVHCKIKPDYCFPLVTPGKALNDITFSHDKTDLKNGIVPN